jgi:hypothetical protein
MLGGFLPFVHDSSVYAVRHENWTQPIGATLYLRWKRWRARWFKDLGFKEIAAVSVCGEGGVVGSLAARGIAEGARAEPGLSFRGDRIRTIGSDGTVFHSIPLIVGRGGGHSGLYCTTIDLHLSRHNRRVI